MKWGLEEQPMAAESEEELQRSRERVSCGGVVLCTPPRRARNSSKLYAADQGQRGRSDLFA